jgi:cyclopropane-fatty-acyl-phospholipid synthase
MWQSIFFQMVRTIIRQGQLIVVMPDKRREVFGDGTGEPVTMHIRDAGLIRRLITNTELALGEGYTDGSITIEGDDLHGFLRLAITNATANRFPVWLEPAERFRHLSRKLRQFNPTGRARSNVAHHYDLSAKLYDLFLDTDKQYSCAYFTQPDMTLDDAQEAKKHHIAAKLLIQPGMRVLDIGCGWGGMALTLARDYGAQVVGVTLSEEQHKIAVERAKAAGLSAQCDFRLTDYRNVSERFDRVVSIGMFEHVGLPHYREFFRQVYDRLDHDGIALIHTIGRPAPPHFTSPWIEKYIFPGGYCPSLSEMMTAVEHERLYPTDIEYWRLHYAETLRHWFDRFTANADKAEALYDARFVRMWKYYMVASEQTFRYGRQCVFQVQLAHRQDAVPLTRDYLYTEEDERMRHAAE